MLNFVVFLFIGLTLNRAQLHAQGTHVDYNRANNMRQMVKGKALNLIGDVLWIAESNQVFYHCSTSKGKDFLLADWQKKEKKPAFDHQYLAKCLGDSIGEKVDPDDLPLTQISYADQGNQLRFVAFKRGWLFSLSSNSLTEDKETTRRLKEGNGYWGSRNRNDQQKKTFSPDSQWVAYIKNFDVHVKKNGDEETEIQLSFDGSAGEYYSSNIAWSPDSKKLVASKVRKNEDRKLYLIESSPNDQLQPKLQTRDYLKPGDALPQYTPTLFLLKDRKAIPIASNLILNQYSMSQPSWYNDSRSFTVEFNQRGHQRYCVIEMDARDGNTKIVIDEQSKTFIDYSGKKYRFNVNDGKEIIWASERDGWNHLYLYDGLTGAVKNQITKGNWVVRDVLHVDEAKRQLVFAASGKEKAEDPYLIHYYCINFDGSGLQALTKENANHRGTFSSDHSVFVDQYSRIDLPPVAVIRNAADGKVLMELGKADIQALLDTEWKMPEVFTAKGRDGETDIWGIIVRPTNFDPQKQYPIIEYIYAGPHSSFVPKDFQPLVPYGAQELAELGFIVVQIDGMGTSNRSKAFHDVCWKNLKDAGFPDRIAWIRAVAEKYPYMDVNRVGIYGTSAGGQSAAGALLFHPDFYEVAVSSCGCHDNRMDKMWWNEQWMGYPIGPHYAESSNVVNAHKLKGKLLLIVGELDDNVDPSSTLQVVDALIKANRNFDFLMVPGMGHSSGGDFGEHKRRDYFVKHLLGVEPPAWHTLADK